MTVVNDSNRPKRSITSNRQEQRTGWLMASPAIILMLSFLIIPFFMAFGFAFTNQRLISPNPTEFVGLRNFKRLLTVRTLTVDPIVDETTGEFELDEDGARTYPRVRTFTRNNPDYPELDGLQEWFRWERANNALVFLAGDAVFMKGLRNTLVFMITVVPIQGGLGLILALIVNQKIIGVNAFRTIYFMPVVVSMVILSILWSFIYDGNNGLLNNLLDLITGVTHFPV